MQSTTLHSLAVELVSAVSPPVPDGASFAADPHAAAGEASHAAASEAVPIRGVRPPQPGARPIVRLKPTTRGVITTVGLYGLLVHPHGPCVGRWCQLCEAGVLPVWAGFVGFLAEPLGRGEPDRDRQALLRLPAYMLSDLDAYYARHETLRGGRLFGVRSIRYGGGTLLDLRPCVDWLPEPLDLAAALALHFELPKGGVA